MPLLLKGLRLRRLGRLDWQIIKHGKPLSGNGLSPGAIQRIAVFNNALVLLKNDSVLIRQGNNWSVFFIMEFL